MIGWAVIDIVNRNMFDSKIDVDSKIKPILLIAFVFFLGMAYAFNRKARITLFLSPENE